MDYNRLLMQMYARRNRIDDFNSALYTTPFFELLARRDNKALRYIYFAMEPVGEYFRRGSYSAAHLVFSHLLPLGLDYRLQGSVMTKTEIVQKNSDIDMVVLLTHVVERENGLPIPNPYTGNIYEDLLQLRLNCEQILSNAYAEVKINKAKSIEVYTNDPIRKVDVVVAHWYQTHAYFDSNREAYCGIRLYDKSSGARTRPDFPFLRQFHIESHPRANSVRCMIRFMKNVIEDFKIQNLSSFQVNAIACRLPYFKYHNHDALGLLNELQTFLPRPGESKSIDSPCGHEKLTIDHNPQLDLTLTQLITKASDPNFVC